MWTEIGPFEVRIACSIRIACSSVHPQFQSGRTLEFNWKSDKHRFWLPRSTRLVVHYEAKFGDSSGRPAC